ncbi:hypothetical protein B0H17DRAFT_1204448 [Mycena rosella]|uniref:Uncharacterized protein n=1 Tax=Mycena rosella TaxID=1033263 RepID=A0AAD7D9K3_MYCRO|nr:hypothetical protein B0H17DRAFT_1204448 [Mycena rosella]
MATPVLNAINASNPQAEMDALTAKVAQLTTMCLDMTKLCIDVLSPGVALSKQALEMTALCLDVKGLVPPAFIAAAQHAAVIIVAASVAPPPTIRSGFQGVALTPAQLEAKFGPAGLGDDLPWQVVCIGREPGLYASVDDANDQLNRVPNQFRAKKQTRVEALAFYRHRYEAGKGAEVERGCRRTTSRQTPCHAVLTTLSGSGCVLRSLSRGCIMVLNYASFSCKR